jgi:hypothetical protein
MLGRATANLIITDKRSDGYPTYHAWGLDWLMADLDRTQPAPSPFQNDASCVAEWALTHAKAIPEINAVILACHAGAADMNLANWQQASSTYWKEVQPPGRLKKWLKFYDARYDQSGALISLARLTANPTWRFSFLRAQPPATQTQPVTFAITMNALGTVRYQLYVPQLWLEDPLETQPDTYWPSLWKSEDAGASWTVVDWFANEEAAGWARNAFERFDFIYCRFIPDHLIISLGESSRHWIYYEDGLSIGEGHLRVDITGGQMAFTVKQALYMSSGTIERITKIAPPDFINPVADDLEYLGDVSAGAGCSIVAAMQSGGGYVWPQATLGSTGYHTPVLYELQATRPAVHDAGVATVLFDNETVPADEHKLEEVEYTIGQNWRASSFRARIRTASGYDEYALTGNEKATLWVKLDTGDPGDTWYQVGTGYLESPKYAKDPQEPGRLDLDLTAHDRIIRLQQKKARDLPAFDGWTFADAFYWVLHEAGAVPDGDISLDAGAAEFVFPTRLGELLYRFEQSADLVQVLDELARIAGRQWGVDVDGTVFTVALGTTGYSGTPDYVLDESAVTDEDHIYPVEIDRDLWCARNHVLVIGRDADGNEVRAVWRMTDSLTNPSADPFIGDDWWEVEVGPEGADPWVRAAFLGSQLSQYRCLLIWQTNGKPQLRPDHYVEVQVANIGIAPGTIFRIIEAHGRLNCDSGEFISHFTAVPA